MTERAGETISGSIRDFIAQTYDLYTAPTYGSFLRVASSLPAIDVIAVVTDIQTAPIDTTRPVVARGREVAAEAALLEANPQLHITMRTTFAAVVVGYIEAGVPIPMLPPQPPLIPGFVYPCTVDEVSLFTRDPGFLRLLMEAGASNDLVTACLRHAASAQQDPSFIVGAGKTLLAILAEQPNRVAELLPLLNRAQPHH